MACYFNEGYMERAVPDFFEKGKDHRLETGKRKELPFEKTVQKIAKSVLDQVSKQSEIKVTSRILNVQG